VGTCRWHRGRYRRPELSKLTRAALPVMFAGSYAALACVALLGMLVASALSIRGPRRRRRVRRGRCT